jgi:hypothetical protein
MEQIDICFHKFAGTLVVEHPYRPVLEHWRIVGRGHFHTSALEHNGILVGDMHDVQNRLSH